MSLGDVLLSFPDSPPAPIPLIMCGIGIVFSIIVLFISWFPTPLRSCSDYAKMKLLSRHLPSPESDSDSVITLVNPTPYEGQRKRIVPHPGFLAFALPALALGIAAAVAELNAINEARAMWDPHEADRVGMTMKLGTLAYRECSLRGSVSANVVSVLPFLPVSLVLAILVAYLPLVSSARTRVALHLSRARATEKTTDLEMNDIAQHPKEGMGDELPALQTHTPEEWTRVSLDKPRTTNVDFQGKKERGRKSWRNTFGGIGMAV